MKKLTFVSIAFALLSSHAVAQVIDLPTTNHSATISTGNTFQTVLPATGFTGGQSRRSLTIQNNNTTTDNCWVYIGSGSPTKGTSVLLTPGLPYQRYYPNVPSDAIQATCATTGDTLYIDTQ